MRNYLRDVLWVGLLASVVLLTLLFVAVFVAVAAQHPVLWVYLGAVGLAVAGWVLLEREERR